MFDRNALIELLRDKSLQLGDFVLASGKRAHYYLDCRKVTLDPIGANLIADGILDLISSRMPDAVGGMAIGADPITAAVITRAGQQGIPLRGFIVRKQAKEHGTGRAVEGPVEAGDHVIIVEDVVTTGVSSLLAIEHAEAAGLIVDGVIAIVDRLEGGRDAFESKGFTLDSLLTIRDFGIKPALA